MPISNYYGINRYFEVAQAAGSTSREERRSTEAMSQFPLRQGGTTTGNLATLFQRQVDRQAENQVGGFESGRDYTVEINSLYRERTYLQGLGYRYQSSLDRLEAQVEQQQRLLDRVTHPAYRDWLQQGLAYSRRMRDSMQGGLDQISQRISLIDNRIAELERPQSPTPAPAPGMPAGIALAPAEQQILDSLFAADSDGRIRDGKHVVVTDVARRDGVLSVGDQVRVVDGNNRLLERRVVSAADIYDIDFRRAMQDNASALSDGGWRFSSHNVAIPDAELDQPQVRRYTDDYGVSGREQVLARNNYWEIVERNDNQFMLMRQFDDAGRRVSPSEAVLDIFQNRSDYRFDCATPMRLLNLKATIDTIGADDFDRRAGRLMINSWFDQHDNSSFDGGFRFSGRTAGAGEISVNGRENIDGEYALFDPEQGDSLRIGSAYYFDKPGDRTSASQGWNAVYLGNEGSDGYRFWTPSRGIVNVSFRDGDWIPEAGFRGYYLAASVASPETNRLANWDSDRSALA